MSLSARLLRPLVALLAMLLVVPAGQLLTAAPAHAAPGVASGAVYDALGDPLAGVTVTAYSAPAYSTAAAGTATDAEGGYDLPLAAGTYHLSFAKAGYTTTWYGDDGPLDVVVGPDGQLSVDGEPVEDNLLADVTLVSTVTHTLTGTVTNESTQRLSGIEVSVYPAGDTTEEPVQETSTNASGVYELDLPGGLYHIGYNDSSGSYLGAWYGGDEPTDVTVGNDGSVSVAGQAACASLCVVELTLAPSQQEWPVAGLVADANGDPVNGVSVSVTSTVPGGDSGSGTTATVADEDGLYSVPVLPGTYEVAFSKTGFEPTAYEVDDATATVTVAPNGNLSVSPAEELTGNRLNDVTLESTPYAVGGVVQAAVGSAPLAGITVRAYPFGSGSLEDVVSDDVTVADGGYTLDLPIGTYDLEFADLDGTEPVYNTTGLTEVKVGQGGALAIGETPYGALPVVSMTVPTATTTYDVVGDVADANGDAVDGIVITADPVGATPDTQEKSDTSGADGTLGDHGRYRLSLLPGTYHLKLDGGALFDDVTYSGDGESAVVVDVRSGGQIYVGTTPAPGGVIDTVTLAGSQSHGLSGKVVSSNGGAAVAGVAVSVFLDGDETDPEAVPVTATTSADGTFAVSGLHIGTYVVKLVKTGFKAGWFGGTTTPSPVKIGQDGRATYGEGTPTTGNRLPDQALEPLTADDTFDLVGEVTDPNGDPVDGLLVQAIPVSPTPPGNAASDTTGADAVTSAAAGVYRIEVKPGTYTLRFSGAGYPTTVYVDYEAEAENTPAKLVVTNASLALDPVTVYGTATKPLVGRVLGEGGPLAGITVRALPQDDTIAVVTATSGADGRFSLPLKVGTYTIEYLGGTTYDRTMYGGLASPTAIKVPTGGITVEDGPAIPAGLEDVTLQPASGIYTVRGTVSDGNGDGLPGAVVRAFRAGTTTQAAQATSATEGAYELDLPVGRYWLRFEAPGKNTTWLTSYNAPGNVTVTVALGGSITASDPDVIYEGAIDMELLLPAPTMVTAPALTGRPVVGSVVTTSFGTWRPNFGAAAYREYSMVEWFLDGRPADAFSDGDYGQKFRVTALAATKRLTYRITIEDIDESGDRRAPVVFDSRAVTIPKAASTVTGAVRKGKLLVTVKVPGVPRPTGKVTVLKGRKVVGKGLVVAKKKGVVVIALKLRKGKHKLTVVYSGAGTVAGSKKVIRIRW